MVRLAAPDRRLQVALVAALAVFAGGCTSAEPSPSQAAPSPTAIAAERARFAFSYRALGTSVLDCVVPNRSFAGQVYDEETFVLATDEGGEIRHLDGVIYLNPELFDDSLDLGGWIALTDDRRPAAVDALQTALGVDLASYLRPGAHPVDGNATVRAALETGAEPEPVDPLRGRAGAELPGWRLTLPDPQATEGVATPVVDYWLAENDVVRVIIRDSLPGERGEPDPDNGWMIDYQSLSEEASAPTAPEMTVPWSSEMVPRAPRQDGCELEIGPGGEPSPAP